MLQQKGLIINSAQQKGQSAAEGAIQKIGTIRRSGCSRRSCSYTYSAQQQNQATATLQKKRTVCSRRGFSLTLHCKKVNLLQEGGLFIKFAVKKSDYRKGTALTALCTTQILIAFLNFFEAHCQYFLS